jgi:hypothetical protein
MRARTLVFSPVVGVLVLVINQIGAAAASNPYVTGTTGYDYSYVQCGATAPAAGFGIVGVNAGYPFTYYNQCLSTEFSAAAAKGNGAVYINTGYDPSYTAVDGRHTTQECATRSASVAGTSAQQAAWAVGCSEAQRDLAYASAQSVSSPTAWWLDVETANSWSSSDLSLNQYTIQGIISVLRSSTTAPVGIYSTALQWSSITGGYQAGVDADWVATGQRTAKKARTYCSSTGFTGAKVWLVQYVTTIDHDFAC